MFKLPEQLVNDFVKATTDKAPKKTESYIYGTAHVVDNYIEVLFDGAAEPTPCTTSVTVDDGDRVLVMIKDRQAVITSNISKPTINTDYLEAGEAVIKGHLQGADGTFTGTVEFVWSPGLVNTPQNIYLGAESQRAPFILEYRGPDGKLYTDMQAGYMYLENEATGKWLEISADNGVYPLVSDRRLKTDFKPIDPELALKLNPTAYRMKNELGKQRYGFVAQDVQEFIPDAVTKSSKKDVLCLNYTEIIAPILATVQHQQVVIEDLERRVEELESKCNQKLSD